MILHSQRNPLHLPFRNFVFLCFELLNVSNVLLQQKLANISVIAYKRVNSGSNTRDPVMTFDEPEWLRGVLKYIKIQLEDTCTASLLNPSLYVHTQLGPASSFKNALRRLGGRMLFPSFQCKKYS